jgi:polar amino acid transport system substrate-binding protein
MRTVKGVSALALVAAVAAACSSGAASPSAAPTSVPRVASVAPAVEPTPDACALENLTLKTAGTLTIGADNPAYPPYFEPSETNPDPWEFGDPTNGGFESAVAYAVMTDGLYKDKVTWVVTAFNNAISRPQASDVPDQVSYSDERRP